MEVQDKAKIPPLSSLLLRQQLLYYGKIARNNVHPARSFIFEKGTTNAAKNTNKKQGRPLLYWAKEVSAHAARISEDIMVPMEWRNGAISYCK